MSWFGDMVGATRRLMLLDADIERMKQSIEKHGTKLEQHNDRLIRIETLIEFGRPSRPPRLPRG